jgi:hypothetical protein
MSTHSRSTAGARALHRSITEPLFHHRLGLTAATRPKVDACCSAAASEMMPPRLLPMMAVLSRPGLVRYCESMKGFNSVASHCR